MIKTSLPKIYQKLIDPQLLKLNIIETKATCHDCLRSRDQRFSYNYKPNLKCCTFQPFLPNYAVGGILTEKLAGTDRILEIIKNKDYSLPLGIFPTLNYQQKFSQKSKTDFGTRPDLLCRYYDQKQNQCSIWNYRGVVCTTYFCTSNYGSKGQTFWKKMNDYLSFTEMALAEDCLVLKDFSPRDMSDQLVYLNFSDFDQIDDYKLSAQKYKKMWNGYTDEVDFYKSCYQLVENHSRTDFKKILLKLGLELEQEVFKAGLCL